MRYHYKNPSKTYNWHDLWQCNIPDVSSLQAYNNQAAFVAIDIEPWLDEGEVAAEIAIALIRRRNIDAAQKIALPTSLHDVHDSLDVHVHNIRIEERKQSRTHREGFAPEEMGVTGELHYLAAEQVESKIAQILADIKASVAVDLPLLETETAPSVDLVMTGFAMSSEFKMLTEHYPGLLEHFSSWTDTQELVGDMVSGNRSGLPPNMCDTILALGFENKPRLVTDVNQRHSAGNDTIRVAAILASLLLLPPDIELTMDRTPITRWSKRRVQNFLKRNNLHRCRPTPREQYPFAARVKLERRATNMTTPKAFWRYFKAWNPTAVGTLKGKLGAWVCFSNLAELESFIEKVDGTESGTDGGKWAAFSHYDDGTVPGSVKTEEQLAEYLEKLEISRIAQKREERARKKLELEDTAAELPPTEALATILSESDKENVYD